MSELKTTSLSHKDNNTGTPNITMYPDGTTSIGLTHTGGFKNQIINGNYIINQRGLGPFNNSGSYEVTSDRWRTAANQGPQVQVTEGNGAFKSNRINANSANIWIGTGIELPTTGDSSLFPPSSTWTFSVYAEPGKSIQLFVNYGTNILGSSLLTVFDGNLDETTKTSNGKVQYTKTITFPSTAVPSTAIMLGVGMRCTTAVDYSLVQLEPGPVATPFELRPIGTEIALCERYYQKSYDLDVAPGTPIDNGLVMAYGTSDNASNSLAMITLKTKMRVPPSLASWSRQGLSGNWQYSKGTTPAANALTTPYRVGQGSFGLYIGVGAAWTNTAMEGHWTADAEL